MLKKLYLGTTSERKISITKRVLSDTYKVAAVEVASGVSDQPIGEEETTKGAKNRALAAKQKGGDIGLGLEAGLVNVNGVYHLVCVAAVAVGGTVRTGMSDLRKLPSTVSDGVRSGKRFGELIREFARSSNGQHDQDEVRELIDREQSFTEAIKRAFD